MLQSAQEGLSVKAVLELQRMEQAASMDTLDRFPGGKDPMDTNGSRGTFKFQQIHVLIGLEVNS